MKDEKLLNKSIGITYGCCERKILGYINNSDDIKEIYSRWAPCWKCRPAIYNLKSCDFFAFSKDYGTLKNDSKKMELKSYKVEKSYSVEEI